MSQAGAILSGRKARELARMRSRPVLSALLERQIIQDVPWLLMDAPFDPEQGHSALCDLQNRLVQTARSRAEAALLNDLLCDHVDQRNRRCPGFEIAPPGAITAVFGQEDNWRLEDIGFGQEARVFHDKYHTVVDQGISWQNAPHQLFGLCLLSAIFESACLSARDLQLFADWLLQAQANIGYHEAVPPWADLKERAGTGAKSRPLRIASGKDGTGLYRLRRLFLAPRTAYLIAQFWAQPVAARAIISADAPLLEAMSFALGYRSAKIRRLSQLLRGAALLAESRPRGPSHLLISLASRDIKSFAATPETWMRALGALRDDDVLKPQAKRTWNKDLTAKAGTVSTVLRHSILQSPAFLQFYMALHDVREDPDQEGHVPRRRGRAQMAKDIRSVQKPGEWPDVLCLLSEWYLHLLEVDELRPSSIERYDDTIGLWLTQVMEDISLRGIAADDLEDLYVEVLESDPRSLAERANLARRLRSLHEFAMNKWSFPEIDREIFAMEGAGLTMRVKASAIGHQDISRALYSLGQDFALAPELAHSVQAAFLMAYRCGLRVGEIAKALLSHYEYIGDESGQDRLATLFIRSSRYGSNKTTNALRQIQPLMLMEGDEYEILENWLAYRRSLQASGPLFGVPQRDGSVAPFDRAALGRIFAEALRRATGLDSLSAHDLRRAGLNNIALALAEQDTPALGEFAAHLTGWSSERRQDIAQMIAASSRREKWEALARFAGHGSSETTFTHYITHADLLLYHGCTQGDDDTIPQEDIFQLLGDRLVRIEHQPRSSHVTRKRQMVPKVSSPALAVHVALDCLDRGLTLLHASKAVELPLAHLHSLDYVARTWAHATTTRGKPRLRKATAQACRLPKQLPKPQHAEALDLADQLIDLATRQPEAVKNWILTVLSQASETNAGVTFRDRAKAQAWLELALQLRPADRWQFDRISPEIDPEERRNLELAWQGVRPQEMHPAARRVKAGASVQARVRLLAPNPDQIVSSNPAKSWAGCITVAAHYAAIWLQIPATELLTP